MSDGFSATRSGIARTPSDVADLVAETFLQALVSVGRYRDVDGDALPWLLGIARRVAAHQIRQTRR